MDVSPAKTLVSIVVPCYNEEAILRKNVYAVLAYMESKAHKYKWEILIINDGSKDGSAVIADQIVTERSDVRVIHHPANLNLGMALQTGFKNSKGSVLVVLDIDLSYSVDHIERMVDTLVENSADIVLASPYMKGGKVTAVPRLRHIMSRWVNRFMRIAAQDKYYTFTGMVRAYRKEFIQSVNLKTRDYEVNPEIIYKTMILRGRIIEIPAHLDWTEQNKFAGQRRSSMKVFRGTISGLMSAFIFRPYIYFIFIGTLLLLLSMYLLIWLLVDTITAWNNINQQVEHIKYPFSHSLSLQFKKNPQTFLVGGITFLAAIQFLSLGFLSLQNKRYFEELYHLGTTVRKDVVSLKEKSS